MKIILISGHDAQGQRKTGFHFWKDILAARGHDVRFITVGVSLASFFKKEAKDLVKPFNRWTEIAPRVWKFTWVPPLHPFYTANSKVGAALAPLFRLYPALLTRNLLREVANADLFIIENGAGPMLAPALRRAAPAARFVYNASDSLGVIKFHPVVKEKSLEALALFNLVRLNAEKLAHDFPPSAPVLYIPQGIDKAAFDKAVPTPYEGPRNAISVGDMLFDGEAIETLAMRFPDWTFHLFGKRARLPKTFANVREYGEVSFDALVPYLKHADIGIAPYANDPQAGYLAQSSLKMVQYTYCRLPVIAPHFAKGERSHVMGYASGDGDSVISSFLKAIDIPRNTIDVSDVRGWEDVIDDILKAAF